MSRGYYCTRIFDPCYIYLQAERQAGSHPELKSLIEAIGYDHLLMKREEDFEDVYPLKTFYCNYKKYILVLTISDETCLCQTFTDGILCGSFDMLNQKERAKNFFSQAGDNLTVIDFYNGKELKPDYQSVQKYIQGVINAENELSIHRKLINEYKERLNEIRREGEVLYATSPSCCYKSVINLIDNSIETAEVLFGHTHRKTVLELEKYRAFEYNYYSLVRMFGLYVYVVNYAISNRRFLSRGTKGLAVNFNQVLGKMRKFIAKNEGIVDKYIDYMKLTKNERENLMYMLSEEQLISDGKQFVGDELFA